MLATLWLAAPVLLSVIAIGGDISHRVTSVAGSSSQRSSSSRYELKFQTELDNSTIQKFEAQQQIFKCQVKLAPVPDDQQLAKFRLKSSAWPIQLERPISSDAATKWPANVSLSIDWFKGEHSVMDSSQEIPVAVINVELKSGSGSGGLANDKKDTSGNNNYYNSNNTKNKLSRIEIKNTLNGQQMKLTSRLKLSQLRVVDSGRYKCVAKASFQVPISANDQIQQQHHRLLLVEQTLDSNGIPELIVANKTGFAAGLQASGGRRGVGAGEEKLQSRERTRSSSNRQSPAVLASSPSVAAAAAASHQIHEENDTQHATQVPIGIRGNGQQGETTISWPAVAAPEGSGDNERYGSSQELVRLETLRIHQNRRKQQQQLNRQAGSSQNPPSSFVDDEYLFKMEQQQQLQQQEIISNQLQSHQSFTGAINARPAIFNDDEDQDDELAALSRRRQQSSVLLSGSGDDLVEIEGASSSPTGDDIQTSAVATQANDYNNKNTVTTSPINHSSMNDDDDVDADLVIGLRSNTPNPKQQPYSRVPSPAMTTTTNYAPFGSRTREPPSSMDNYFFSAQLDSTRLRLAKLVRKIATDELSCYTGLGEHYRGNVSTSADRRPCLSWMQVRRALGTARGFQRNLASSGDKIGGRDNFVALATDDNHNHCRNPSMESQGPWCFVQYSEALDANLVGEHFVLVSATLAADRDGNWNSTKGASDDDKQIAPSSAPLGATRYVQRACSISPCSDYLWLYIVAPPFGLLAVLSCLIFIMIRALRKSRYQSMMLAKGKKTLPSKLNKLLMGSSRLGAPKKSGHKSATCKASSGGKKNKSYPSYIDDDIFEIVNDIDWSEGSGTVNGNGGQALTLTPKSTESLKIRSSNSATDTSGEKTMVKQMSSCKSINPIYNDKALDQQRLVGSNRSAVTSTTTSQVGPMFATLRCHIREKDGKHANSTSTFIENCNISASAKDTGSNQQPTNSTNADWLSLASPDSDSSPETSGIAMDFSCESSKQTGGSHLISCSNTTDDIEAIDCCSEKYIKAIELPQLDSSSISICLDQQQALYEGKFSQVKLAYLKQSGTNGTDRDLRDIGAQVAICSLKSNSSNAIDSKLFKPMNLKLRHLNHLNLLKLIGYSHIAQDEIGLNQSPRLSSCCSLVYDMARLVDLSDWLKQQNKDLLICDEPAGELGLRRNLTCFAKQVALALDYLHDLKIIYKDLTCRNCFLDPTKMLVKLVSFNIELVVNPNDAQAQNLNSMIRPKYLHDYYVIDSRPSDCQLVSLNCIPLESILFNKFNKQTDVWSFGCLIYELFSFGEAAYFGYSSKQVIDSVRANLMPPQPLLCPSGIYKLMCKCLSDIPSARPNVKQIYEQLNLYSGQCSSFLDHHLCSLATNMYDDQPKQQNMFTANAVTTMSRNCNNNNICISTTVSTSSRNNSITKTKSYANIKNCSSQASKMRKDSGIGGENQHQQSVGALKPEFAKIPLSKSINLGAGNRLLCYSAQGSRLELDGNHYDEPIID